MDSLHIKAYAKINLGLDVLRRRPDGYHEVKMIMQTVGIHDDLEFQRLSEDRIVISVDQKELPADESNLIWKAAKRMKEEYGIAEGISVKLTKRIPIAAGMAGGSADAAATIHAVDALFGLGLTLEQKQAFGVKLGADIPYCLMGGTALSEGIGEILTALPDVPQAEMCIRDRQGFDRRQNRDRERIRQGKADRFKAHLRKMEGRKAVADRVKIADRVDPERKEFYH